MSGTQLAALILLTVASFACGWFARGSGRRDGKGVDRAIREGGRAAEAAMSAVGRAVGGDSAAIAPVNTQLKEAREALAERLGPEHPLVQEVETVRGGLMLVAESLDAGAPPGAAEPMTRVVRDAAARYRRAADAIAQLPAVS